MNRREKQQMVSELQRRIEGFQAAVLTNYRGLNVEQINALRRRLREEKMSYHVIKNTLMKIASKGSELEKLNDYIDGPTAIAISYGDPVSLAKILSDFIKNQPLLEIKAGLVQGKVISSEEVKALANMPSRETMLAQILSAIQTSAALLLGAITSAFQEFLYLLQARIEQLEKDTPSGEGDKNNQ